MNTPGLAEVLVKTYVVPVILSYVIYIFNDYVASSITEYMLYDNIVRFIS